MAFGVIVVCISYWESEQARVHELELLPSEGLAFASRCYGVDYWDWMFSLWIQFPLLFWNSRSASWKIPHTCCPIEGCGVRKFRVYVLLVHLPTITLLKYPSTA